MEFGVSTASLFLRMTTEDALQYLDRSGVDIAEVFLSTYSEYTEEFASLLKRNAERIKIRSVHTLNTQFEPQLYSAGLRAEEDAFNMLESVLTSAERLGAKSYTFHGVARLKKTPLKMDFAKIGERTGKIIRACRRHGVALAYENVHWAYYNFPGFFGELKERCPELKGVLDVKQAWQSGCSFHEFIDDMKGDIVTVHISDRTETGELCLPGKGVFPFRELRAHLRDVGFDGAVVIEVYQNNYGDVSELLDSVAYLKDFFA